MKNLTLVLNADDTPLNVTPVLRAFNLVYKGKAVIVTHDVDNPIVSEKKSFERPTIIRLTKWLYIPRRKIMPLTRQNIFKRDGYNCAYCGSNKNLTIDHIIPKSKGGKNTWENLVTCCAKCNCKKDNMTLREAKMVLRIKPTIPTYLSFITTTNIAHIHWITYFENRKNSGY